MPGLLVTERDLAGGRGGAGEGRSYEGPGHRVTQKGGPGGTSALPKLRGWSGVWTAGLCVDLNKSLNF